MTKANPLQVAIELAKEAGKIQMDHLGAAHNIEYKSDINIVTEVDKKCEAIIVSRLQKDFPSHDILAEEGSGERKKSPFRWIIDPLDATVNFSHTYPFFGPSIALEQDGKIILGVVFIPCRNELFIAEKGSGATLNGQKIRVTKEDTLKHSLLCTGFAYNIEETARERHNLEYFRKFLMNARALRRDGMAAGDLCYVAAGRFDGFWELNLCPWDIAAGVLIVQEAGGTVTGFNGADVDLYGTEIVASNGKIHEAMLKILQGTSNMVSDTGGV